MQGLGFMSGNKSSPPNQALLKSHNLSNINDKMFRIKPFKPIRNEMVNIPTTHEAELPRSAMAFIT